ncbi:MAG: hypothetical protein Q8O67_09025 [Deltaproteobacteria bacterium]|nr:hypothetical protein [Deltaproteobacteria bacterium]
MSPDDVVVEATLAALADGVPVEAALNELAATGTLSGSAASTAKTVASSSASGQLAAGLAALVPLGLAADLPAAIALAPGAAADLARVPPVALAETRGVRVVLLVLGATLLSERLASTTLSSFVTPVLERMIVDMQSASSISARALDATPMTLLSWTVLAGVTVLLAPKTLQALMRRLLPQSARARKLRLCAVLLDHGVTTSTAAQALGIEDNHPGASGLRVAADDAAAAALSRLERFRLGLQGFALVVGVVCVGSLLFAIYQPIGMIAEVAP